MHIITMNHEPLTMKKGAVQAVWIDPPAPSRQRLRVKTYRPLAILYLY